MAQARRKSRAKPGGRKSGSLAGIGMLLAGMVIGSLATILWQGAKTDDGGIGAGIRRMSEGFQQPPSAGTEKNTEKNTDQQPAEPHKPSTNYAFFDVLPGIEVAVPSAEQATETGGEPQQQPPAKSPVAADDETYVLQAGSYRRRADADRLKATLAFNGMVSSIQKVSIQDRGDFYRVRLGPYSTYEAMAKADQQLSQAGIKALRLKVYKAG